MQTKARRVRSTTGETRSGRARIPHRAKAWVPAAAVVLMLAVPASAGAVTLFGSGSSAEQPVLNVLFKTYHQQHHNIKFSYNADGGNQGVKDIQSGRSEFAVNTRPPLPSDHGTTYIKIFLDGLCVGVNRSNSVGNLSITQVKNIFLGLTTSWTGVPGSNLSATIDPVGRDSAAGSYTFFQQAALGGQTQASNVLQETSDGLVATQVSRDPNAIGYVGLSHSGAGSGVKKLKLNGKACSATNIKRESYPLWRFIWAVIKTPKKKKHGNPQVAAFINWIATSHAAGRDISKAGAVPAFNK